MGDTELIMRLKAQAMEIVRLRQHNEALLEKSKKSDTADIKQRMHGWENCMADLYIKDPTYWSHFQYVTEWFDVLSTYIDELCIDGWNENDKMKFKQEMLTDKFKGQFSFENNCVKQNI